MEIRSRNWYWVLEFHTLPFSKSSTSHHGWNDQVEAIYKDLCTRTGTKRGLLLDVSLMKVYVEPSIFDKALEAQLLQENLNVMVYYGKGGAMPLCVWPRGPYEL